MAITYRNIKGVEITAEEYDESLRWLYNALTALQTTTPPTTLSDAWSIGGMDVRAYATNYPILNTFYTAVEKTVTHAASDGTYAREDAVVADINGDISIIQGAAGAVVIPPTVDENLYYLIRRLLIPANATSPVDPNTEEGITAVLPLYSETGTVAGGETDVTPSAATIVINSPNSPIAETVSIEATNVQKLDEIIFQFSALQNIASYTDFRFKLQLKAALETNRNWFVRFYKEGNLVASKTFLHNQYGFNAQNLNLQHISIPKADLAIPNDEFDKVKILFYHNLNTIPGYWIDDVEIIKGFVPVDNTTTNIIPNNTRIIFKSLTSADNTQLVVGDSVHGWIEDKFVYDAIYLGGNPELAASYNILGQR